MDGDFTEKLKTVLSDPEAMAKITAIASGLGASRPEAEPKIKNENQPEAQPLPTANTGGINDFLPAATDPRIALLSSIKPLLREDKRGKIDSLTRALAVASMMKNLRK